MIANRSLNGAGQLQMCIEISRNSCVSQQGYYIIYHFLLVIWCSFLRICLYDLKKKQSKDNKFNSYIINVVIFGNDLWTGSIIFNIKEISVGVHRHFLKCNTRTYR